jgi:hypothetical protein
MSGERAKRIEISQWADVHFAGEKWKEKASTLLSSQCRPMLEGCLEAEESGGFIACDHQRVIAIQCTSVNRV